MFSHLGATQTLCDLTSVIVCVLFLTQWMVSIINKLIQRSRSNLIPSIQAQSSEADECYLYLDPQDLGQPIPDPDYPIREGEEVEQYSLYTPAHLTFQSL